MPQKRPRAEATKKLTILGEGLVSDEVFRQMQDSSHPDVEMRSSGSDSNACDSDESSDVYLSDDTETDEASSSEALEDELASVVELRRDIESRRYLAKRVEGTRGVEVYNGFAAQINDATFQQEYRMSRRNFNKLVQLLAAHPRMRKRSETGAFKYLAAHRAAVGLNRLGSAAWLGNTG